MGIYGHNFGDLKIQEITAEEALEANLIANYALVEFYEDDSEEVVEEGANLEIRNIFKQYKKDVKDLTKKYKEDYKNNKEEAIKDLDKINDMITKTIKEIKKVDADHVSTAIIGTIYSILLDVIITATGLKLTVLLAGSVGAISQSKTLVSILANAGGASTGAIIGTKVGKQLSHLIANFKKFKDGKISAAEYFNLYRGEIIQNLESAREWNNGLKVGIRAEIKKSKEEKD